MAALLFSFGLSLCSIFWNKLAIFSLVAWGLVLFIKPKRLSPQQAQIFWVTHCLSALAIIYSVTYFTLTEAVPGIIEGGQRAMVQSAISKLREIYFAQNIQRQKAFYDPEKTGKGPALFIAELVGGKLPRGQNIHLPPLLNKRYNHLLDTNQGKVALIDGYLFMVCLPSENGLTAFDNEKVQEKKATTQYVVYAWSEKFQTHEGAVIALDQNERILISNNQGKNQHYHGTTQPPSCHAALSQLGDSHILNEKGIGQDGGFWHAWKNKKPKKLEL